MALCQVLFVCVVAARGQWADWNSWNGWNGWNAPMATTYSAADPWSMAAPMMMASSPLGHAFSYSDGRSARSENALLGVTAGTYSYRDPEGKVQTVNYKADAGGFRAEGTNLPVMRMAAPMPVQDTPEVAAAKAEFMAMFQKAKQGMMPMQDKMPMMRMAAPMPVQDTAEVAAAKAEFMMKFREAEMRQRKRRSVVIGLSHTPASTALLAPALLPAAYIY